MTVTRLHPLYVTNFTLLPGLCGVQSSKIYLGVSANAKVSNLITSPKILSISEEKKLRSFEIYLGVVRMSNVWNLTVVSKRLEFPNSQLTSKGRGSWSSSCQPSCVKDWPVVYMMGIGHCFCLLDSLATSLGFGHPLAHPQNSELALTRASTMDGVGTTNFFWGVVSLVQN
jgi:hypothetical protein